MQTSTVLRAAYGAIAATDVVLAASSKPSWHRARRLTKPLLMPVLAASLVTDRGAADSPLRSTTLAGEAAGWVGDVTLLGEELHHFRGGAAAFATGHATYITGLLRNRDANASLAAPAAVGAAWVVGAPRVLLAAGREDRALGAVLGGYSLMLSGTAAAATVLDPAVGRRAKTSTLVGAGLFLLSDTILGFRRFVLADPPAWMEGAVMATYTAAQYLIADGAAHAAR